MGNTVIKENMFPELVELYNGEGKIAVYDLLRTRYGMKQPYYVLKRIKNSEHYEYDPKTDRFRVKDDSGVEEVFLNLDELCAGSIIKRPRTESAGSIDLGKNALEKLVNELINDRLLTLSKYITLDNASRTILIDETSLSQDGFRIISH